MTAALYFKWQYTKVHFSQTGKRHPDRMVVITVQKPAATNTPD